MKRKINIFIFLLLSFTTYAHIGIATIKNASCQGVADGSVGFYLYGNAGPFSYQIIDDAGKVIAGNFVKGIDENLITVDKLDKGKYKLVVTNSKINIKCEVTKEFEIKCCPPDLQDIAIVLESKGFDPVTGGFINTIVKTKAQGSFYYNWNSPSGGHYSTENLSDLTESGQYCVTVTNGCESAEACFDLSECGDKSSIVIDGIVTPTSSIGGGDGAIDITVTGGSAPYEITWWDGKGNIILTQSGVKDLDLVDIVAGAYKVKVSDGTECTIATFVVYDCDLLAITPKVTIIKPSTLTSNDGSITLTLSASSNPKVTYFWQGKSTGFTSNTKNISNLAPDMYCLIVKDESCGLVYEECYDLLSKCGLYLDTKVLPYCTYGIIDITPVNGTAPYTYQWSQGSGNGGNYASVGAGNHVVKVTDSKGCFVYGNYNIVFQTLNIVPNITDLDCDKLGEIELTTTGGLQPYTYKWSNGINGVGLNKISNLPTGNYSVEVSSANGCKTIKNFSITFPNNAYGVKIVQPECLVEGLTNGIFVDASYNGNPNCSDCTYLWDDGNTLKIRTFTKPGTYTVKVKNPQGCEGTATYNVMLAVSFADCSPASVPIGNGMIGLLLPSGFSVKWKNPVSFATNREGLKSGDYEASISYSDICTITKVFTLPKASFAGFTTTALNCKDKETEIATWGENVLYPIKASSNGMQVAIANTANDKLIIKSKYSSENITFEDARGCSFTKSVIFEDKTLKATFEPAKTLFCEGGNTQLGLTITGYYAKNPPFEYELFYGGVSVDGKKTLNSSFEFIKTIDKPGPYSIVVKKDLGNGNFCMLELKINVAYDPSNIVKPSEVAYIQPCNGNNGSITLNDANTTKYTYLWNNGTTGKTISNIGAGTYNVVISNIIPGCNSVSVPYPLNAINATLLEGTTEICPFQNTGELKVTQINLSNPKYLWNTGATTNSIKNLPSGTYTVTITDDRPECTLTGIKTIKEKIIDKTDCGSPICDGKPINEYNSLYGKVTLLNIIPCRFDEETQTNALGYVAILTQGDYTYKLIEAGGETKSGALFDGQNYIDELNGDYTLIVYDKNNSNCQISISFRVVCCDNNINDNPKITSVVITQTKDDNKTGSISIEVSDAVQYVWTLPNGTKVNTKNLTNLDKGKYCVNIIGFCGSTEQCFTIIDSKDCKDPKPSFKADGYCLCNSGCNPTGKITTTISNASNYSFVWSNNAKTKDLTNIKIGGYALFIKDNTNGCTFTYPPVQVNALPKVFKEIDVKCNTIYTCDGKDIKESGSVAATRRTKEGSCDYSYQCAGETTNIWHPVSEAGGNWEILTESTPAGTLVYDCQEDPKFPEKQYCVAKKTCPTSVNSKNFILDIGLSNPGAGTDIDCKQYNYCYFKNATNLNNMFKCTGTGTSAVYDGKCCTLKFTQKTYPVGESCKEPTGDYTIEGLGLDKDNTGFITYNTCKGNKIETSIYSKSSLIACPNTALVPNCSISGCELEFCKKNVSKNGKDYSLLLVRCKNTLIPKDINGDGKIGLCDGYNLFPSDGASGTPWPFCDKETSILPKIGQSTNSSTALNSFSPLKSYVYPNPFDDAINVVISAEDTYTSKIIIRALSGQEIFSGDFPMQKGGNKIELFASDILLILEHTS